VDSSHLKREIYHMPDDVKQALNQENLMNAYSKRPPYQQNDYIGWIIRAKTGKTREKRIHQMLEELHSKDRYMKMPYRAKK
jgi:uncharacterized protein YdeI (YjbR/CyaY-like superfamily)